jgi:acetyl esterase/lipase
VIEVKRSFILALVLALGLAMAACGDSTPSARPTSVSPSARTTDAAGSEVTAVSDVLYQEDPDGTQHVLRVYAPATEDGPWPVAVMIHGLGGGMAPTASEVADHGVVVFVPTWAEPRWTSAGTARAQANAIYEQIACAVVFARADAERYGGDPSNLTLYGHSAGAGIASIVALSEPEVPEGCVARSGSVVPDNLVLFEGDWLVVGSSFWDDLLREDPRVMDTFTPWSYLDEASRMPVHILDSDDTGFVEYKYRAAEGAGRWLALRDPTGTFRRSLEKLGAFDDGELSERDVQRLLLRRLKGLGYEATFHNLPDSSHNFLSEAGVQVVVDAILQAA